MKVSQDESLHLGSCKSLTASFYVVFYMLQTLHHPSVSSSSLAVFAASSARLSSIVLPVFSCYALLQAPAKVLVHWDQIRLPRCPPDVAVGKFSSADLC